MEAKKSLLLLVKLKV
jgi:small subunit ribosomal protein S13